MSQRAYATLAPELVEYADRVACHLETSGYRVQCEKLEHGFPFTPTLLAKRGQTTLVVEVCTAIDSGRLDNWIRYGKSSGQDFRVSICISEQNPNLQKVREQLRVHELGLLVVSNSNVDQWLSPRDLALNVSLPDRADLPKKIRTLLGIAYDQFDNHFWREGFDEGCKVLEVQARNYLKKWIGTGRIQLTNKKGIRKIRKTEIEKLSMGQLAEAFRQILAKNYVDSIIGKTLELINKDRVSVVHHKTKKITETRLRKNVGRHMWAIIEALKLLV